MFKQASFINLARLKIDVLQPAQNKLDCTFGDFRTITISFSGRICNKEGVHQIGHWQQWFHYQGYGGNIYWQLHAKPSLIKSVKFWFWTDICHCFWHQSRLTLFVILLGILFPDEMLTIIDKSGGFSGDQVGNPVLYLLSEVQLFVNHKCICIRISMCICISYQSAALWIIFYICQSTDAGRLIS